MEGCSIAREALPEFGYSEAQTQRVCDPVMATKLPTGPKDALGMILCDADLDYLGRSDFFRIGATLFQEFKHYGIVKDERDRNELQVRFMESQTYYTPISRAEREPQKQVHLLKVKAWLVEDP